MMSNEMESKEKIKVQLLVVLLYCVSELMVVTFLSIPNDGYNKEEEYDKLVIILGLIAFFTFMVVSGNKLKNRIIFCYFCMGECVVFSVTQLYAILEMHYETYGKIGVSILFIYSMVFVILFWLNRNFYKKLPVEEPTKGKEKEKSNRGVILLSAVSTLGVSKYLSTEEKNVVYVLLSLVISCGWLAFSWALLQGKKAYLDDSREDAEELDS